MSSIWQAVGSGGPVSARIVAEIERVIEERHLRPGDRLPAERELAQLLGVSRPSVREAVRRLEARGRLVVRHGVGARILPPGQTLGLQAHEIGFRDLFAMREVLEVPAAGWAAERAGPDDVARLRGILAKLAAGAARGAETRDYDSLQGLDISFHLAIATLAGNRFLRQVTGLLHDMLLQGMETTLVIPGRLEASQREHGLVCEGIAAADPPRARAAMRRHIRHARAAGLRRLAG
ncbi:MAG TPA: FCD domain-containing protein [Candidatus Dormibacteraeota bacterium]|jgi:GntR family transcriptional repressor for pyruvate dehydrogenase complex|nr:FCD domain-containing protein [Candidatus Dormibacteraeota bacterium]